MAHLTIASHHKCATQFTRLYLQDLCRRNGLTLFHSHLGTAQPDARRDLSLLTNADPARLRPRGTALHVIRNPLSVVLSAYYSHRNSHPTDGWPELVRQRQRLERLSTDEGLRATLFFLEDPAFFADTPGPLLALARWDYDDPAYRTLRMEDFVADPNTALLPFAEMATDRRLDAPDASAFRFETMSGGRRPGEIEDRSHYRSGRADAWRAELPEDVVRKVRARCGHVIARFHPEAAEDETA